MGISCWRLQERVQVKLFSREWVGVLLFLGMTVGIWVLCQPKIPGETGELLLTSAYPYKVAFFWSWMQYLPILYLVSL